MIKYDANYVRVHPCCIILDCNSIDTTKQHVKITLKPTMETNLIHQKLMKFTQIHIQIILIPPIKTSLDNQTH